ncbi:hypothetical protein [Aureivirga sp. CE67]|uniref:hypothetical protein n=1 Tax=Aureivirga sp. CE67 TaxID=1788983 RepID=UPI0018CA2DA0|nr:hypothetical protein [Aureivirga sp. CE67]
MALRRVKSFKLKNQGGFVCDIHCIYFDDDGNQKGDIPNHENFSLGKTRTMDIKDKIPSLETGSIVKMKAWVQWGNDNTYPSMFVYDPDGDELSFSISGTTLDNSMGLDM